MGGNQGAQDCGLKGFLEHTTPNGAGDERRPRLAEDQRGKAYDILPALDRQVPFSPGAAHILSFPCPGPSTSAPVPKVCPLLPLLPMLLSPHNLRASAPSLFYPQIPSQGSDEAHPVWQVGRQKRTPAEGPRSQGSGARPRASLPWAWGSSLIWGSAAASASL